MPYQTIDNDDAWITDSTGKVVGVRVANNNPSRQTPVDATLVGASIDPLTGGSVISASLKTGLFVPPTLPVDAVQIGQFSAQRSGVHRVTVSASSLVQCLDSSCETLGAYAPGYGPVPVEVQPESTKSGGAVIYVRAPAACTITVYTSVSLRRDAAQTVTPINAPILNTSAGLSASHSAAGGLNPITSFVHPSMVYISGGWNGYSYWMTATPWAGAGFPSADRYEDGMLFASNDAVTWTPININASGYANLTSAYANETKVATDCRLVFDASGNSGAGVLYAYQRYTGEIIIRQKSINGTTWTNDAGTNGAYDTCTFTSGSEIAHPLADAGVGVLSPSVIVRNGEWILWATMMAPASASRKLYLRQWKSLDGKEWSGGEILPDPWSSDTSGAWHSDIQFDPDTNLYVMLAMLLPWGSAGTSVTSNVSMLFTSQDGRWWKQYAVPAAMTGLNAVGTNTETTHIYKGCLCRTAARTWIVGSSYSILDTGTKLVQINAATAIYFDRPRITRPSCAVFDEPVGRWYGSVASVLAAQVFQKEPAWATQSANGTVSIASGRLTLQRNSGNAAQVLCGTRLTGPYRLLMRMKLNATTAIVRVGIEDSTGVALAIEGPSNLLKLAQTGDAGVAYTDDLAWHEWELRREEIVSGASWKMSAYRDGTLMYSITTSNAMGNLKLFVSGGSSGNGVDIDYIYKLPIDCPTAAI